MDPRLRHRAEALSTAGVISIRYVDDVDLKNIGVTVSNTRQTRTVGILLELDSPERADTLAEKVRQDVTSQARVTRPERRTPILLGVPSWVDEADVRGGLAALGIISAESAMLLKEGRDGRGYRTALVTVPYDAAIKVANVRTWSSGGPGAGFGCLNQQKCFCCQGSGHLAAECKGPATERACHRCVAPGRLAKSGRQGSR